VAIEEKILEIALLIEESNFCLTKRNFIIYEKIVSHIIPMPFYTFICLCGIYDCANG